MEEHITTILYDGQFWIALVEHIELDGTKLLGKYTFGPEPSNTDLLHFYLERAHRIELLESAAVVRIKHNKSDMEQARITRKSFAEFSALQKERLGERQKALRTGKKCEAAERFELKKAQRKARKRGH